LLGGTVQAAPPPAPGYPPAGPPQAGYVGYPPGAAGDQAGYPPTAQQGYPGVYPQPGAYPQPGYPAGVPGQPAAPYGYAGHSLTAIDNDNHVLALYGMKEI